MLENKIIIAGGGHAGIEAALAISKMGHKCTMVTLNKSVEMDILASQLKSASDLFDELLGKLTPSDVLNNIFKGFCVGK